MITLEFRSTTSGLPFATTPSQARSLRHGVEGYIMEQIRSGALRPGERLQEAPIARTLGVSLTPVREALLRLVHDGLVVHRPRRGYFLVEMCPDHIEEIYTFRAVIEGLAAARLTTRLTPQDVSRLEALIEEGAQAARDGDALRNAECNADFHTHILASAQHSLLERAWRMLSPLRWLLAPAAVPATTEAEVDQWVVRHRLLLDALRSGNPTVAEEAARTHVLESMRRPLARITARTSPKEKGKNP